MEIVKDQLKDFMLRVGMSCEVCGTVMMIQSEFSDSCEAICKGCYE